MERTVRPTPLQSWVDHKYYCMAEMYKPGISASEVLDCKKEIDHANNQLNKIANGIYEAPRLRFFSMTIDP